MLVLAAVEESARDAGYWSAVGCCSLTFALPLIYGVWKCFSIARRPTTNTKTCVALGLVFLSWLLGSLLRIVQRAQEMPVLQIVAGFAILVCVGVAFILAIIGLVEIAHQRERYRQGKAQGWWAIGLCTLIGLGTVASTVLFFVKQGSTPPATLGRGTQPFVEPVLGFRIDALPGPWVQMDAAAINPLAQAAFFSSKPEVYALVIAEQAEPQFMPSREQVAEIVLAQLRSVSGIYTPLSRREQEVDGVTGLRLLGRTRLQRTDLLYLHWIACYEQRVVQLILWAGVQETGSAALESAADQLLARLHLERRSGTTSDSGQTYDLATWGCQLRWGAGWQTWPQAAMHVQGATLGGQSANGARICVLPLPLAGTPPSLEDLRDLLLGCLLLGPEDIQDQQQLARAGLHGLQLRARGDAPDGGAAQFVLQVVRGEHRAWLLAGWAPAISPGAHAKLQSALETIRFEDAAQDVPASELEAARVAGLVNDLGLLSYDRNDFRAAARHFERACQLQPADQQLLSNLVDSLSRSGHNQEALELLQNNARLVSTNQHLQSWHAFLKAELGDVQGSLADWDALFSHGYDDPHDFEYYCWLLVQAGRSREAAARAGARFDAQDSIANGLLWAALLSADEQSEQALELVEGLRERASHHPAVQDLQLQLLIELGRNRQAYELADQLQTAGRSGSELTYWRALAAFELGWLDKARTGLEQGLQRDPGNTDLRSFLHQVQAMLGDGGHALVAHPIPRVPLPELARLEPAPTLDTASLTTYGAYYLEISQAYDFQRGSELRATTHTRMVVVDRRGVERFSTLRAHFDPIGEQLYVNTLFVLDPEGETLSVGQSGDYYLVDEADPEVASQRKVLHLPIAALAPGCTIDLVLTRRQTGLERFPYVQQTFGAGLPVVQHVLSIAGDTQDVRFSQEHGVERLPGPGLGFRVTSAPGLRWEADLAPLSTFLPTVRCVGGGSSWSALGLDYLARLGERLPCPPALEERARALTRDVSDDSTRCARLLDFVSEQLVYKAIAFGRRAEIPSPSEQALSRRWGDCKDHSLILMQMLQAVGIEAHLALVHSHEPVDPELPDMGAFDHMIVYLPATRRWLDATDKLTDPAPAVPSHLAGGQALVLDPRQPELLRMPEPRLTRPEIDVQRTLHVRAESMWVEERLQLEGNHASILRALLQQADKAGQRTILADMLETAQLDAVEISGLRERRQPLLLVLRYRSAAFESTGQSLVGRSLAPWERIFLEVETSAPRRYPFVRSHQLWLRSQTLVEAPDGYVFGALEPLDEQAQSRFGSRRIQLEGQGAQVRLRLEIDVGRGQYPAAQHQEFARFMNEAVEHLRRKLELHAEQP